MEYLDTHEPTSDDDEYAERIECIIQEYEQQQNGGVE
jgi:hypothetical protein